MVRRLSYRVAAGVCLLLALASAYHASAGPPAPGQSALPGQDKVVLGDATEQRPNSHTLHSQVGPAAIAMAEDFEGAWPAPGWEVSDLSTVDGGEYFWGKRTCHPHTGSFAGWATGGGAQGSGTPCSANYPNNVRSWAVYGPFDLRGASAASLSYHFWGYTEVSQTCAFDFLFVGSSADGTNFQGPRRCGDWTTGDAGNGYYQSTLDLSNRLGQAEVWVAFVLASDNSIAENGIAIDDIALNVDGANTPTFTPTSTPSPTAPPTATASATPTTTPGQVQPPTWIVHLPVVMRDHYELPPIVPTATTTPDATSTATPSPTSTATPIVTATPIPEPQLPIQVTRYAFGTTFDNSTDCEISDPHPWPITYPPGTTQIAFQVVFDVTRFQSFSARIDESFGGTILGTSCNKYTVIGGSVRQSQLGATIARVDGAPLQSGTYYLKLFFDGNQQPALVVPFEIQ